MEEVVRTGLWVGDCFIYTNAVNRLNYYVGGEIVTISHLDRYHTIPMMSCIMYMLKIVTGSAHHATMCDCVGVTM